MRKREVLWCQHHVWYGLYKRHCIRSVFLKCDSAVLDYLRSDSSLQLPFEEPGFAKPKPDIFGQVDSDAEWSDWSSDENEEKVENPIPQFTKELADAIEELGKRVVPKLNWSCPSDAAWQMSDNSVMATRVNEVFLLLKSSDKVNHDLSCPFEHCEDCDEDDTAEVEYNLCLQRNARLKPASEFRCFVRSRRLIAFCSRDSAFHGDLVARVDSSLRGEIVDFIEKTVLPPCPLESFVVDLYARADGGFYIFGFSPFGLPVDARYFSWAELKEGSFDEVEFRCNDGNQIVPLSRSNTLPQDVIHIASGLDIEKFVDYAKLVKEGQLDGERLQM